MNIASLLRQLAWLACASTSLALTPSAAEIFELRDGTVQLVGAPQTILAQQEDTFIDIGRLHNLGYEEMRLANPGVDAWLPGENTQIVLPSQFVLPQAKPQGIVINLAEYRLYYFYQQEGVSYVATWPASIGRMDWETPLGLTRITAKAANPSWYPPDSVRAEHEAEGRELPRVVPPGPDNPLGKFALRLGLPGYLIHGTNRPAGVGMRVTHGCIRLFPEDIEWLFGRAGVQTPVRLVNQPVKFGWLGDELFMEAHPTLSNDDARISMTEATRAFVAATAQRKAELDWDLVAATIAVPTGIPVRVGRALTTLAATAAND